jgi:drug/metabolite transporter (DMT)-like permease
MSRPSGNPLLPYLWMICGSVAFTLMATFTREASRTVDWQVTALVRAGLACLFAAMLAAAAGAQLVFSRPPILWMRSIAGSISLLCTFYSLNQPQFPVSEVLTLTNIFPVWVAVLSWPVLGEVPSLGVWVAVFSGVTGVALIQQPHFARGDYEALIPIGASVATAVAMMGLHHLQHIDARAVVAHFSGVATVACIGALFMGERHHSVTQILTMPTLLLLLAVGASATVGQLFLTKAFTAGNPARVSVVGLVQIVFALAVDITLFGVKFDLSRKSDQMRVLGMVLILTPTAWVMLFGLREPKTLETTLETGGE